MLTEHQLSRRGYTLLITDSAADDAGVDGFGFSSTSVRDK